MLRQTESSSVFRLALMPEVASELPAARQLECFDANLIGKLPEQLIPVVTRSSHAGERACRMPSESPNCWDCGVCDRAPIRGRVAISSVRTIA